VDCVGIVAIILVMSCCELERLDGEKKIAVLGHVGEVI
jgi:hypothetical protein